MTYPTPQAFIGLESKLRSLSSLQKVSYKFLSFCKLGRRFHRLSCVEWQEALTVLHAPLPQVTQLWYNFLAHRNSKRWGQPLGWHMGIILLSNCYESKLVCVYLCQCVTCLRYTANVEPNHLQWQMFVFQRNRPLKSLNFNNIFFHPTALVNSSIFDWK